MKYILLLCFFFISCGIQEPTSTSPLFTPNGLTVEVNTISKTYVISFQALNPESEFTGYNLYSTTSASSAELGQGNRIILKNTGSTSPDLDATFFVDRPFFQVSNFTYTITEDQMPAEFFDTPSQYYFMVRSYSRSLSRESVSSLSIRPIVTP